MSLLVIDSFLELPTIVRQWAIAQQYYDCKQFTEMYNQYTDWPGKRTKHIIDLDPIYADKVLNQVATLTNMFFGLKNVSIKSYFQLTTKHDGNSWIHQDNNVNVAGILYLNPNPPPNSGTILYKCKDVNKWQSYMDSTTGYNTLKTINNVDNQKLYNDLFEINDVIGNVFNRLILYDGNQYHKSNEYFGENNLDGRLTQVFFITKD